MSTEFAPETRRRLLLPATVLICAAAQFAVLTVIAMVIYPGGAKFHRHAGHYLFFGNFFSDLGATRTVSGHSNTASHVLFVIALGLTGLALVYFAPTWHQVAQGRGPRTPGLVALGAAVVSGIGFIGIAATPWNVVYDAHNLFVRLAFGVLLVYVVCMIFVQSAIDWPSAFTWLNVAYFLLLLAYVVILFLGPDLSTTGGLRFQAAAQKVIVYASILNLGAQAAGVRIAVRRGYGTPPAG